MKKEYIYASTSIFVWSTIATVTKLLLNNLNSMQVTLVSSLFAALFLLVVTASNGAIKEVKNYKAKDFLHIVLLGAIGIFAYHLFLYIGIDKMDASQAFIINYLWPIMTVLFACIVLKEKMTGRKALAIVLSFVGVIVVTANGNLLSIEKETLIGALYCVAAAVAYGLFSVLNKRKSYNSSVSMMFYCFVSFVICLIYVIFKKDFFTLSWPEGFGMLWNGAVTIGVGYTSWALALKHGDTAKVSNLAYITPFLSLVWTTLVLHETFNPWSLAGLGIIVLGIFIQLGKKKKGLR